MMTLLKGSVILIAILVGWRGYTLANDAGSTTVKMVNAKGQEVGEAILTETPNGVLVRLTLRSESARHSVRNACFSHSRDR